MLTWSEHGHCVKMDAANDAVRGPQRVRDALWYATGATAGTSLMLMSETKGGAPICPGVAEAAQFAKALPMPKGVTEGITVTTLAVGHVMLYFEEIPNYNPKRIHEETAEAAT